jgi:hypothetical protein
MSTALRWQYFPKSEKCPDMLEKVIYAFSAVHKEIDSSSHENQSSNTVLAKAASGLQEIGFVVETGKAKVDKISVPVLYGQNGKIEKYFDADAWHPECQIVLEVEAGRALSNNQFLKDLFQACVMQDVEYLGIAVRNDYRGNDDYSKIATFIETLYASTRLNLPLKGILIIGY